MLIQHTETTHPYNVNLKLAFRKVASCRPHYFNIYTADLPPHRAPVQIMAYPDGFTITSTHTGTSAVKKYIQPYTHKVFVWTKHKNLTQNTDKTTLFSPDPTKCTSNVYLKINNAVLTKATH